jgi:hypothetical protein
MASLAQARRAKFHEQLRLTMAGRCHVTFQPTKEYPGSPGKILVLTERQRQSRKADQEIALCCAEDARLPLDNGWRFDVEPNGRVPMANRALVYEDQARARAHEEQLKADRLYVLEEIHRLLATEDYPCPAPTS